MSFAATLACLPSESIDFRRGFQSSGRASRTINDHLDLVINALHFVTYIPHFVAYFLDFAVYHFDTFTDAVCDPENLRMRHTSLLLRQPIKFLESTLQISQSGQLPQKPFYA
jgi:hypothetical protein